MTQHIFLSPHLDDAVLSCGGLLAQLTQQGQAVQVINIFAGIPPANRPLSAFARYQHRQWQKTLADPPFQSRNNEEKGEANAPPSVARRASRSFVQIRRAEDKAALLYFNAQASYLNFYDCIYRGSLPENSISSRNRFMTEAPRPQNSFREGRAASGEEAKRAVWYYTADDDIFGPVHPAEARLSLEIARALQAEIKTPAEQTLFYAPLSVGNHVDHQLGFLAATQLAKQGYPLLLYQDYPYAQRHPDDVNRAVQSCAQALSAPLHPQTSFLSETHLSVKINAISAYASQLHVLFGGEQAMRQQVMAYARAVGKGQAAEQLWTTKRIQDQNDKQPLDFDHQR